MLSIFSYFGVFNTIISWKMDDIMCLELSLTRPKSHSEKAKVEHVNITAITCLKLVSKSKLLE